MTTKKAQSTKPLPKKRAVRTAMAKHNSFDNNQTYALLLLLSTQSQLVLDINAKLGDSSVTAAQAVAYFNSRLQSAPFSLAAGSFNIAYFTPLLLFNGKKRATFDTTIANVAAALELPYDTPPCPPDPTQTQIWNRLVNLQP
jgi:hypothetical protein